MDRVDLAEGAVRLDPGTMKNKEGRLVYLPGEVRAVLESQWQEHLTEYPDCRLVFHRGDERILSFYKAWYKACDSAGIGKKVAQTSAGAPCETWSRQAFKNGAQWRWQATRRAIFDRYHIVSDGDLREAARRLDAAMKSQTTTRGTETGEQPEIIQ